MKIPGSIRALYYLQYDRNVRLKEEVDQLVRSYIQEEHPRWHYESRVKGLESFALKVETGRFSDPSKLEDFFACTVVVTNSLEVEQAEQLICERFVRRERRPARRGWTHKRPDSFPFDDLRLYLTLKEDPTLPPNDLVDIVFEFQIKTYLQHAWGIATHDLVYKANDTNWGKERIAYQIKAMLEHAELSIEEATRLSESLSLRMEDNTTTKIRKIIELLQKCWDKDSLPEDTLRLARNVKELLDALDLHGGRLMQILDAETKANGGALPLNLSPYATIVQALLRQEKERMRQLLSAKNEGKFKALIPAEIDFPSEIDRNECCNAIFLDE